MKRFIVSSAISVAMVFAATVAHADPGDPIPGIPVGLEHEPERTAVANSKTDERGNVAFANLKPGRVVVVLPDTSTFKVPARVVINWSDGKNTLVSEPIMAGKAGAKAYALDKAGQKLTVEIPKTGPAGKITVRVETAR